MQRRKFVKHCVQAGLFAALPDIFSSCASENGRSYPVVLSTPDYKLAHKIREGFNKVPSEEIRKKIVIVGAGITGLSAARCFAENGENDFTLLELEKVAGGNSRGVVSEKYSAPLGAHYLPVPDINDRELIKFLDEAGLIESIDAEGLPFYKEEYLCASPHERLFFRGKWKEGLIPEIQEPSLQMELKRFFELIDYYKDRKGGDGKWLFTIPLSAISDDEECRELDGQSFKNFLIEKKINSKELIWYLDYCCRDDYGAGISTVSAYAGLHYFCSRRGRAQNAEGDEVLTWPEGNFFLVQKLKDSFDQRNIALSSLVYNIGTNSGKPFVDYLHNDKVTRIVAEKVLIAVPRFVAAHLLSRTIDTKEWTQNHHYAPWLIANIILNDSPAEFSGESLSWDNVIYGSRSLGYIHSTHQSISLTKRNEVFTWYKAFDEKDVNATRRRLLASDAITLWKEVRDEMLTVYPQLESKIKEVNLWIWGHGMICPVPGFITGEQRQGAMKPLDKFFFAHSDLSGISIFEEAFHQGRRAAFEIMGGRS